MRSSIPYIVLFMIIVVSCKHDVINSPAGQSTDTTIVVAPPIGGGGSTSPSATDTVCFNTDILPLYVSYCGSSGCHDLNSHREGVVLTDYSRIMKGIRSKNASNSSYYTIIVGGSMPPSNSAKMTTANIALIKRWIDQGALNTQCINVCDTTKFTYTNAIQGILTSNCGGCHGTRPGTANVYLGDYASTKSYIIANKTIFVNAINWTSTRASMNMPQSAKMVACKITQIQKWIDNGYPQ